MPLRTDASRRRSARHRRQLSLLVAGSATAFLCSTSANAQSVEELGGLSIEQLAQVEVRSASKRAQPVSEAPTAIYVITSADIASSPATSLPEILRMAPNLQVQRVDARQYSVSARGFGGIENANKLLVLIDGRSVYSTLHSGVFWELHSPLLEDIAQIEVISGPGGTLHGPNAVNGVINLATKDAHDTLGSLARVTAGANERTAGLRYGASLGNTGAVRFYANAFDREGLPAGAAPDVNDHFRGFQAGFRADVGAADDKITLQGDVFNSDTGQVKGDGDRDINLLSRWTKALGAENSFQVQAYYDSYKRRFTLAKDWLETFDVEGQLNLNGGAHQLVLGGGVRTTKDRFVNNLNGFVLDPESRRLWVLNAFVQDQVSLSPKLSLIAGLKAERSSFSGIELLPSVRLAWQASERSFLWAAVSRAVRTPSRIDRQLVFPSVLLPAPDFTSEKLVALEAGYRGQLGSTTTLSASVFYNIYEDLRTTAFTPVSLFPAQLQNGLEGHSYGLDAWIAQQITPAWRMNLGVSTLSEHFHLKPGRNDLANLGSLGFNPHYQLIARSQLDLGNGVSFEVQGRAVDDLRRQHAADYVEADARLGWRLNETLELYVAGNNLLHKAHAETADPARSQLVDRSVYAGTRIRL